eukprot:TRINITY_DN62972_c0_g1_i1.p1 TRINITY_DN62972_c0_g1~~TRINITY_DN62972_c0_g1_i1.p1  ORF type:complete len:347 (+),score=76.14 TRINITY_DN62972_c0_g1_i1:180-1220(+)
MPRGLLAAAASAFGLDAPAFNDAAPGDGIAASVSSTARRRSLGAAADAALPAPLTAVGLGRPPRRRASASAAELAASFLSSASPSSASSGAGSRSAARSSASGRAELDNAVATVSNRAAAQGGPGATFLAAATTRTAFQDTETDEQQTAEDKELAKGSEEMQKEEWDNTEGLPTVKETKSSVNYVALDMADGKESNFRPNLGCKCGDWRPAPTHPTIEFRNTVLQMYPDFRKNVSRIKVHMEDKTARPPKVHWDAEFDMQRFKSPETEKETSFRLKDTHPAIPGTGKQIRFMTFCPQDKPHTYEMKVTAYDENGELYPWFNDSNATFTATPPPPEAPAPPNKAAMA